MLLTEVGIRGPVSHDSSSRARLGSGGKPDALAFLIPMEGEGNYCNTDHDLRPYLASVDTIEALTGLDLLTVISDDVEAELEAVVHIKLWD